MFSVIFNLNLMLKGVSITHNSLICGILLAVIAPPQMPNLRKVLCYPVQLSVPCPRLPSIDYLPEREQTVLRFQGDAVTINNTHLQKLVSFHFYLLYQYFSKILENYTLYWSTFTGAII